MARPHILHIYKDYYPPVLGGIETTINLMARGSLGHYDVTVLVCSGSRRGSEEVIDGVHVVRAPEIRRVASAPVSPAFVGAFKKAAAKADLLHFHHPNPTGDLAALVARSGKPAVMTYHSDVVRQRNLMWVYAPLQHAAMRRCAVIMPTSPNYLESSLWLQRYRQKCIVVPLGIDHSRFIKTDDVGRDAAAIRQHHSSPLTLFIGRLRYYKGLHYLLHAMKEVPGKLLIGGTGPEEFRLRQLIQELHLANRVVLLGDLTESQLVAHMYAADVFCMPSHLRSEAFGLSQVEAMACGLPVVSTRIESGVPFVNTHKESGLTVPPSDPVALATALTRLLTDVDLHTRLGDGARHRAQTLFSSERMCEDLHEVYSTVLRL